MSDAESVKPAEGETTGGPGAESVKPAEGADPVAPPAVASIFVVRRQEVALDQVVLDQTLKFVRDARGRLVSDLSTVDAGRRDDVLNVLAQFPSDFLFEDAGSREIVTPKIAEPEIADGVSGASAAEPPPRQDPKYLPGRVPGVGRRRRGR